MSRNTCSGECEPWHISAAAVIDATAKPARVLLLLSHPADMELWLHAPQRTALLLLSRHSLLSQVFY
jgi:hypothetical protein